MKTAFNRTAGRGMQAGLLAAAVLPMLAGCGQQAESLSDAVPEEAAVQSADLKGFPLTVELGEQQVTLHWPALRQAQEYTVFRRKDLDSAWSPAGRTATGVFAEPIAPSAVMEYQVEAVSRGQVIARSEVVRVQGAPVGVVLADDSAP